MTDKFILIDLDDSRSKDIAEVLSNKTCRKVIDYLAGVKEASEKDISDALSIPINTVEYNLNKLIKTGLVEKTKNFFWSRKGRKIVMYKLSNRKILISPKSLVKGVVPAFLGVLIGSIGIKLLGDRLNYSAVNVVADYSKAAAGVASDAPQVAEKAGSFARSIPVNQIQNVCSNVNTDIWAWFLFGGLVAILIFLLWNQYKKMKGGLE